MNHRIKLVFSPSFEGVQYVIPYGMCQLNTVLLKKGYDVAIDDLQLRIKEINMSRHHIRFDVNLPYITKLMLTDGDRLHAYLVGKYQDNELTSILDKIIGLIFDKDYDIIGFSVFSTYSLIFSLLVSKRLKEVRKCRIIIGGPCIHKPLADFIFTRYNFIDHIVVGFGARVICDVIDLINKRRIWSDFKISKQLIFPTYAHLGKKYVMDIDGQLKNVLVAKTSSGCNQGCRFCSEYLFKRRYFYYNLGDVVQQMNMLHSAYGAEHFLLEDNAINLDYANLDKFCILLIRNKQQFTWEVFAKAKNLDSGLLLKMKKAGCTKLYFGIESGSQKILDAMNKGIDISEVKNILISCSRAQIKSCCSFIVGYPLEAWDDFMETVEFIRKNSGFIHDISAYPFMLHGESSSYCQRLFGTDKLKVSSYDNCKDGLFMRLNWVSKYSIGSQTSDLISEKNQKEIGILQKTAFDHFYRKEYPILKYTPYSAFKYLFYKNKMYSHPLINYMLIKSFASPFMKHNIRR